MSFLDQKILDLIKQKKCKNEPERKEVTAKIQKHMVENSFFSTTTEGDKYKANTLNGIFVATKINWTKAMTNFAKTKEYEVKEDEIGKKIESKLVLKDKVFPIRRVTKEFSKCDKKNCFCNAEILLSTGSMSKTETINHLHRVKEKAHENIQWLLPLTDWLNSQKIDTFYYVVDFEITCGFDIDKYLQLKEEQTKLDVPQLEKKIEAKIGNDVKKISSRIKRSGTKSVLPWITTMFTQTKEPTKGFESELTLKIEEFKGGSTQKFETELGDRIKEVYDQEAINQLIKETSPYAQWATEYISEKIVFHDLCNVFDSSIEDDSTVQKPSEQVNIKIDASDVTGKKDLSEKINVIIIKPPDTSQPQQPAEPSIKFRYLTYTPLDLSFTVKIEKKDDIRFGEIFEASLTINNESVKEVLIDDNLKINVESDYFKIKEGLNNQTVTGGKIVAPSNGSEKTITKLPEVLPGKKVEHGIEKKASIIKVLKIKPEIKEISDKFLEEYPITFSINRSTGYLKKGEDDHAILDKREIQLCKCEKKVTLKAPIMEWTIKKPWFPHKADQIDLFFTVKLKQRSNTTCVAEGIPVNIDCIFGSDFTPIDPIVADEKSKTVTRPNDVKFGTEGKVFPFTMSANRAGFPGYSTKANFKLSIGKWKDQPVDTWKMSMIVLPNLTDTFLAGVIGLAGILSYYRPDLIPSFTEELNIANLATTPGLLYLAYRVLNWTKQTKEKEA